MMMKFNKVYINICFLRTVHGIPELLSFKQRKLRLSVVNLGHTCLEGYNSIVTNRNVREQVSQCGSTNNCLSRSVSEVHWHVAGTFNDQPTNQQAL